jgi:hypothetical protein
MYCPKFSVRTTVIVKHRNNHLGHLGEEGWLFLRSPQQMLRTHRSLEAYCATLWQKWLVFFVFPCNGAPVEWNLQEKNEVLREIPVPVPVCPPQIPHGLTRHRTRASAVRSRRLTAWIIILDKHGVSLWIVFERISGVRGVLLSLRDVQHRVIFHKCIVRVFFIIVRSHITYDARQLC